MAWLFDKARLRPVGDRGLLVEYGDAIAPEINRKVRVDGSGPGTGTAVGNGGGYPDISLFADYL